MEMAVVMMMEMRVVTMMAVFVVVKVVVSMVRMWMRWPQIMSMPPSMRWPVLTLSTLLIESSGAFVCD